MGYVSIADVGTDHGLVACYLAEGKHFKDIYAIDRSELSLKGCYNSISKNNLTGSINVILGEGFDPLISTNRSVDVAILAGTSSATIASILSGITIESSQNSLTSLNESHIQGVRDISNQLGLKCLAIQPWPSELIHQLQLFSLILRSGWKFFHQDICASNSYNFQLTTFFVRAEDVSKIQQDINFIGNRCDTNNIFRAMPLMILANQEKHVSDNDQNIRSDEVWVRYLLKQYRELAKRILKSKSLSDFSFDTLRQYLFDIESNQSVSKEDMHCIRVLLSIQGQLADRIGD